MAGSSRRNGDLVLGGRHLVGIFALLVIALGMVFTLGYLLGRSRYEEELRAFREGVTGEAAAAGMKGSGAAGTAGSGGGAPAAPQDWEFYRSGEPARTPERLNVPDREETRAEAPGLEPKAVSAPTPKPAAARPAAPAPAAKAPAAPVAAAAKPAKPPAGVAASTGSALIPPGAVTLQVAALLKEADALALAQALQDKKFPAIVTTPTADRYYRVQVGPYADTQAATAARRELEKQGFKPIVRR